KDFKTYSMHRIPLILMTKRLRCFLGATGPLSARRRRGRPPSGAANRPVHRPQSSSARATSAESGSAQARRNRAGEPTLGVLSKLSGPGRGGDPKQYLDGDLARFGGSPLS